MIQRAMFPIVLAVLALLSTGCRESSPGERSGSRKRIATSDTILSGMCESLLPPDCFEVAAILPPGQCPGHYDIKLTDIAKVKKADLVVSFRGMPFMNETEVSDKRHLVIDEKGRNWMAPPFYIAGLTILADRLTERFPEYKRGIAARREKAIREASETAEALGKKLRRAGVTRMPVLASSMLREPLEWMGFRIAGEYGRPESMSAKEIAALIRAGREERAIMIVDNLQSGPEAGKGIAEALEVPHVVFSNFPSEEGYAATLRANVRVALAAAETR